MAQLGPIQPGDIVELDIKGRQFFGKVQEAASGKPARIRFVPLDTRITFRTAKASEVVAQYRRTKNVRQASVRVDMSPEDVQD